MIDEILNELVYLDDEKKKNFSVFLNENKDTKECINKKYNKVMSKWHQKYNMFDIPSGIIAISIDDNIKYYNVGTKEYPSDTIFDLASMTKLYTEYILFNVIEEYNLSLDTKIKDLVNTYKHIGELSFRDLISFKNTYLTEIDIRNCKNKKAALEALRTIYVDASTAGMYQYTDLPIMVVTDVLEMYTSLSYKELFNKYIINKFGFKDTYLDIDKDNDKYLTINEYYVNDPKANIMGGYYGHAGVKATCSEYIKFLNIILESKQIDYLTTKSSLIRKDNGKVAKNVALVGNINLSVEDDDSIASIYMPKKGFAVQGSVRCHAEACEIEVNNIKHKLTFVMFLDLYTQYDNIKKYEKEYDKIMSKEYSTDDNEILIMTDIRSLFSYKEKPSLFKELVNDISMIKYIDFIYKDNK